MLEIVKNGYNDVAAEFDATRKKALWPMIYKFTSGIKNGDYILDLACGNGRLLEALKDKKINYLGADNSEELLNLAKQNYPGEKFILSDMLNLDGVEDGKFNYIFCLAALQHIPSQELRIAALKKIHSKLGASGRLIISNWNLWARPVFKHKLIKRYLLRFFKSYREDWNDLIFPWKDATGQEKSQRYYHAFTGQELKYLALSAGFKIHSYQKDKHNFWLELGA